jgi:hypothetical protein
VEINLGSVPHRASPAQDFRSSRAAESLLSDALPLW